MQKKVRPLGNRVYIQRCLSETKKGGIILPDSAQEKPQRGKVVAVGPGKVDEKGNVIPLSLKVGDLVLFSSYAGMELESEDCLVMSEDDVLAVLV